MSMTVDWIVYGKHKDGSYLTEKERKSLQDATEYLEIEECDYETFLGSCVTTSINAIDGVEEELQNWTKNFNNIELEAFFTSEYDENPMKMKAFNGKVTICGSKTIYDDEEQYVYIVTRMDFKEDKIPHIENDVFENPYDAAKCSDDAMKESEELGAFITKESEDDKIVYWDAVIDHETQYVCFIRKEVIQ